MAVMYERSTTLPVACADPSPKSISYVVVLAATLLGISVTPHTTMAVPIRASRLGIISVSADALAARMSMKKAVQVALREAALIRFTRPKEMFAIAHPPGEVAGVR